MDLLVLIAKAADVCLKPWSHAVVLIDPSAPEQTDDLHVRIECRDGDGQRCSDQDLELEIYRSGDEINLMLSWWDPTGTSDALARAPSGLDGWRIWSALCGTAGCRPSGGLGSAPTGSGATGYLTAPNSIGVVGGCTPA